MTRSAKYRLLAAAAVSWLAPAAAFSGDASETVRARSVDAGLAYLRTAVNPDGSFGSHQRHFQTGICMLAFLSSGMTPSVDADSPLPAAARWLLDNSPPDGFLGDGEFALESHAAAALALSELVGESGDADLDGRVFRRVERALAYALNVQDRAVGADYYGGWKASTRDRASDRRVTAWHLLLLRSMELRGSRVAPAAVRRALEFMEGSQKLDASPAGVDTLDIGGFSYDAAGLPIVSITGAGLACMSLYDRDPRRRDLAVEWLARNPPIWYGPNFYYTWFFAARGLSREASRGGEAARQAAAFFARITELLREHQNTDGSFQLPPGNAENTLVMGKPYATAMAVLILNAGRNLMPIDARSGREWNGENRDREDE